MSDPAPGSVPLSDTRREQFANLMSSGLSLSAASREVFGAGQHEKTAGNRGSTLASRSDVRDRVTFLRKAALATHRDDGREITRGDLLALSVDVTDALMAAADAAEEAGASPRQAQDIRRALTTHAGRVQRLTVHKIARPVEAPHIDLTGPEMRLRRCTCLT